MAAIAVVILVALALASWEGFLLLDLARAERVRFLPRWAWAVACLAQIPLGGLCYLAFGRVWGHRPARLTGPPAAPAAPS